MSIMETITEYLLAPDGIPKTSVFIAHRLGTIKHCDIIYVMDNGSIIESGDHESLLKLKGMYFRLWDSQQDHRYENFSDE